MTFDAESIKEARERNGAAADDRPDDVDDVLAPRETVGFREELHLLERPYDEYVRHQGLLRPVAGDVLRELADHPLVSTPDDVANELGSDVETVEKAADLHGVDLPDEEEPIAIDISRLDSLVGGGFPEDMADPTNPILIGTLYVSKGLSVTEVAQILSEATDDYGTVDPSEVRQTLVDAHLINGETSAEGERRRENNKMEINRPHHGDGGGININTRDFE